MKCQISNDCHGIRNDNGGQIATAHKTTFITPAIISHKRSQSREVLQFIETSDVFVVLEHIAQVCHRGGFNVTQLTITVGVPFYFGIHTNGFHIFIGKYDGVAFNEVGELAPDISGRIGIEGSPWYVDGDACDHLFKNL